MALLESHLSLDIRLPTFSMPDINGSLVNSDQFDKVDTLLLMFLCGHCPYVIALEDRIIELCNYFSTQSFKPIAICSNDGEKYPLDNQENLKIRSDAKGYNFTYLMDIDQQFAKTLGAVCTPEFYLFDSQRILRYHGEFDNSWQDAKHVTQETLKIAIKQVINKEYVPENQRPSRGCSIKWK